MDSWRNGKVLAVVFFFVGLMLLLVMPAYCAEQAGSGREGHNTGIEVYPGGGIFVPAPRQVGSGIEGRNTGQQLPPGSRMAAPFSVGAQNGSGVPAAVTLATSKPGVGMNDTIDHPPIPTLPKPGVGPGDAPQT